MFKRQLKSVEFKLLSNGPVLDQFVIEVLYGKMWLAIYLIILYTTLEKGKLCATCFLEFRKGKDHFCHIVVGAPRVILIVKKQFKWVTQHFCRNYGGVIITKNHLMLNDIKCYKPSSKYIEKEAKEPYPKEPYNIATELNIIKVRLEELYEEDVKIFNF